jgi:hypothetical protein
MSLTSMSFIKSNRKHYAACHEILGLPEEIEWSRLSVSFGTEEFGEVTLVLIPSGEQVRQLAELAVQQLDNGCAMDDMPDEDHLEEAILAEARASVALDGDAQS